MIQRSSGLKRSSVFETVVLSLLAHVKIFVLVLLPFRGGILAMGMLVSSSWIELRVCLLVRGHPLRGVPLAVFLLLFRVNTVDGQMVLPQVRVQEPLVCSRVLSLMVPRILPMLV